MRRKHKCFYMIVCDNLRYLNKKWVYVTLDNFHYNNEKRHNTFNAVLKEFDKLVFKTDGKITITRIFYKHGKRWMRDFVRTN